MPARIRLQTIKKFSKSFSAWVAAILLAAVGCYSLGCKRQAKVRLSAAQIHQITQELTKAATESAPAGSLIRSRSAPGSSAGPADTLAITMHGTSEVQNRVLHNLESVASAHHLDVESSVSEHGAHVSLRANGLTSHRIEIELLPGPSGEQATATRPHGARLAILLDDFGSDRSAADAVFALRQPITISVLPYKIHSVEISREAKRRGCEVMLHLPMQSMANESPEPHELRPGLSGGEVRDTVAKMLQALPEADGVNNHQGSKATADRMLMAELMPVLKQAGFFYVDSRTTAETVAYDAAKEAGVKTAYRNVPFIDDVQNKAAIEKQLRTAIQGAKDKGEAIAIGHPHPETLAALREVLPDAAREGVHLVFVSEVVH